MVNIKRIYEPQTASDGYRVLVDRLWPRGVSKAKAALDVWLEDIAPSNELRTWFGHRPERFAEFKRRYETELASNSALQQLRHIITNNPKVTLLYVAHDPECNQARVLADYLQNH